MSEYIESRTVDDAVQPLNVLRYFYGTALQGTFTFFGQSVRRSMVYFAAKC